MLQSIRYFMFSRSVDSMLYDICDLDDHSHDSEEENVVEFSMEIVRYEILHWEMLLKSLDAMHHTMCDYVYVDHH